jgi:hypothetical protein
MRARVVARMPWMLWDAKTSAMADVFGERMDIFGMRTMTFGGAAVLLEFLGFVLCW